MNFMDHDDLLKDSILESDLKSLIEIVARTSAWVNPEIYESVQVVYPRARRKKGTKESRGQLVDGARLWDNQPASHALWTALGTKPTNSFVCHIYEGSVWDPEHFTNLANIVGFPRSIASLSEWGSISDVLKYHSYKLYGYAGPEGKVPEKPDYYPKMWYNVDHPGVDAIAGRIHTLQEQERTRPTFNGKDTPNVPKGAPMPARHARHEASPPTPGVTSAAVAVWVAAATLHREAKSKDTFEAGEIAAKVKQQQLCTSNPSTIQTHIYTHCVANRKAASSTHRKLVKVHGRFRLYRDGDDFDPSRRGGRAEPSVAELPDGYKDLHAWYHGEYLRSGRS